MEFDDLIVDSVLSKAANMDLRLKVDSFFVHCMRVSDDILNKV